MLIEIVLSLLESKELLEVGSVGVVERGRTMSTLSSSAFFDSFPRAFLTLLENFVMMVIFLLLVESTNCCDNTMVGLLDLVCINDIETSSTSGVLVLVSNQFSPVLIYEYY